MIHDADIKKEYESCESLLSIGSREELLSPFHAQIYCGVTSKMWKNQVYPAGCARHKLFFKTHNIIPRYCFDCYKIEIQPRTVSELFKLLVVFKAIDLKDNNTRKCFLRPRKDIAVHYAGLIYFQSLIDAKKSLRSIKSQVAKEIAPEIPMFIKRGCTNFAKAHPDYAELGENNRPVLKYKKKWKKIEDGFDNANLAGHLNTRKENTFPNVVAGPRTCLIMRTWLSYAKTIGDDSYHAVTDSPIGLIPDLDPAPFNSD
ncbi:MAG: hypothetical protein ABW090_15560 [Sedimenticola sp.]